MTVNYRLLIFGPNNGTASVVGDERLKNIYDQWRELSCDPSEKKLEVVGLEDTAERTPIQFCVLWEDVKGMQLEILRAGR